MSKPRKHSAQSSTLSSEVVEEETTPLPSTPDVEEAVSVSVAPDSVEEAVSVSVGPDSPADRSVSRPATPAAPLRDRSLPSAVAKTLGKRFAKPSPPASREPEALFDAWHASFSDQLTLSLARKHLDGNSDYVRLFALEDDRVSLSEMK